MKADVLNLDGKKIKDIELPIQFYEEYRPDLIKRAVEVIRSNKRQPYGAFSEAGKRYSAKLSRRRRDYKGAYGHGISRVPRKTIWRRGMQFGWVGALAPGTVGGRRAHPPKAEKIWTKKINKKERRKAIRSAIAATAIKELITILPKTFIVPLILDSRIEDLTKTKDVENLFKKIGLEQELSRIKQRKIRAGIGKLRGRKYKKKEGPLIVTSKICNLIKSAKSLNIDVCEVDKINVELLSQGLKPRLTIWTDKAIERLHNENLFLGIKRETNKVEKQEKEIKKTKIKEQQKKPLKTKTKK